MNSRLFSLTDIQERKHLTGEIINIDEVFMPSKLFLVDSLLFTVNRRQSYFISVFQLQDMKKVGDFIPFGSGPNEVNGVTDLQFQDSLVWLFDQSRQQINKYQLNQFIKENEVVPCEIIKIGEPFAKALMIQNKLITNSLNHIRSRFSFYDLQGNFIENKGEIPNAGILMTDLELYESYSCNMALNPSNESIFVSYMNTDLIEIYNSDGTLKTRIHGPDHFYPIRKEESSGDTRRVRSIPGQTKDAYFSPVAFEDEIWTIYRGKVFDPAIVNGFLSNTITTVRQKSGLFFN